MLDNPATSSSVEDASKRGKHKIFLGYAPGVGKTFAMLDEAHRRLSRGQDIVIGAIEVRGRQAIDEQLKGFEVIPTIEINDFPTLDVDKIISRHPETVLVDRLQASDGQRARWAEVERILDAGINVISTLDARHLESLHDALKDITGAPVEETVPDRIFREAEEVEMVDLTPQALLNRIKRGDVQLSGGPTPEWFTEGVLSALREIALREVAGRIDHDVNQFRKGAKIEKPWATRDKVMICLSPTRASLRLVRKGWRLSQRTHADAVAVFVEDKGSDEQTKKLIRDDFTLAERLGIQTVTLHGTAVDEIVRYAKDNNVTQLVIGHSSRSRVGEIMKGSIVNDLLKQLRAIDVLVVALDAADK